MMYMYDVYAWGIPLVMATFLENDENLGTKPYWNHAVKTTECGSNAKPCGVRCVGGRAFGLLRSRW